MKQKSKKTAMRDNELRVQLAVGSISNSPLGFLELLLNAKRDTDGGINVKMSMPAMCFQHYIDKGMILKHSKHPIDAVHEVLTRHYNTAKTQHFQQICPTLLANRTLERYSHNLHTNQGLIIAANLLLLSGYATHVKTTEMLAALTDALIADNIWEVQDVL